MIEKEKANWSGEPTGEVVGVLVVFLAEVALGEELPEADQVLGRLEALHQRRLLAGRENGAGVRLADVGVREGGVEHVVALPHLLLVDPRHELVLVLVAVHRAAF